MTKFTQGTKKPTIHRPGFSRSLSRRTPAPREIANATRPHTIMKRPATDPAAPLLPDAATAAITATPNIKPKLSTRLLKYATAYSARENRPPHWKHRGRRTNGFQDSGSPDVAGGGAGLRSGGRELRGGREGTLGRGAARGEGVHGRASSFTHS